MPLLGIVYGLSRKEALALPSWEFRAKVEFAAKYQSRQMLELYQVISVGSWGEKDSRKEYLAETKKRAGYDDASAKRPKVELPTQDELRKKMDAFYAVSNLPMVF